MRPNQILHVRAAGGEHTENCVQRARGRYAKSPGRTSYLTYHRHQEDPPDKDKRFVRNVEVAILQFTPFIFQCSGIKTWINQQRNAVTDSGHRPSRHLITRETWETPKAICLFAVGIIVMYCYQSTEFWCSETTGDNGNRGMLKYTLWWGFITFALWLGHQCWESYFWNGSLSEI